MKKDVHDNSYSVLCDAVISDEEEIRDKIRREAEEYSNLSDLEIAKSRLEQLVISSGYTNDGFYKPTSPAGIRFLRDLGFWNHVVEALERGIL